MSSGFLESAQCIGSIDADFFINFLEEICQKYDKPITLILDNAPIHKAKGIQPRIDALKKKGLTLYFLPTYSPELNRIEVLWRLMKHRWMEFKCRTINQLTEDVSEILDHFGTGKYKLNFS